MATRYVWSKYSVTTSQGISQTACTYAYGSSGHLQAASYTIADGKFSPSGNTSTRLVLGSFSGYSSAPYLFLNKSYPASTIYVAVNSTSTGYRYWNDDNGTVCVKTNATQNGKLVENGLYRLAVETIRKKGSISYGYISNASSSKYPSNSYSGSYWYVKEGSDCIDPTALACSEPKAGRSVTITATERSNTYGGTISYTYEYSVDGGSTWTTIETTTATSTTVTVPNGAEQFQARVRASDDMGFTSTTYVCTDNVEVSSGGIGYCGVEGVIREGTFHACVDGVIKTDFTICVCVDGVIKECS